MDEIKRQVYNLYQDLLSEGHDGRDIVDTMFQAAIDIALDEGDDLIARQLGHG